MKPCGPELSFAHEDLRLVLNQFKVSISSYLLTHSSLVPPLQALFLSLGLIGCAPFSRNHHFGDSCVIWLVMKNHCFRCTDSLLIIISASFRFCFLSFCVFKAKVFRSLLFFHSCVNCICVSLEHCSNTSTRLAIPISLLADAHPQ